MFHIIVTICSEEAGCITTEDTLGDFRVSPLREGIGRALLGPDNRFVNT